MRIELKEGSHQSVLLVDHRPDFDPEAFEFAFGMLDAVRNVSQRTLILYGKCLYEQFDRFNQLCQTHHIQRLILIGDCWRAVKDLLSTPHRHFKTANDFLATERIENYQQHAVLLRGAQGQGLRNLERFFLETGYKTVLEVDLDALLHNLDTFRTYLEAHTRVLVVVKASAYGHGAVPVALLLQQAGVDYLAVSSADEGVELRKAGIHLPIIVQQPLADNFELILRFQLQPALFTAGLVALFIDAAERMQAQAYPIHLSLDTGTNRLGLAAQHMASVAKLLADTKAVRVASLFSDLADSGNPERDELSWEQLQRFDQLSQAFVRLLPPDAPAPLRHILNSDGILRFPDYQFDMVRLGLGVYGINAYIQHHLRPVASLRSTVAQIREIEQPSGPPQRIALVPIGYADGIDRNFGQAGGHIFIKNHAVAVQPTVSMDLLSAEVSHLAVAEGDAVVFFDQHFSLVDLANLLHQEAYVVLARLSKRIRRVYYRQMPNTDDAP